MPSRYENYTTHHTSRRTDDWDYTRPAAYFVTICTEDRGGLFGTVERGRMYLNALGKVVAEEWQRSETIRDRVHLDAFIIMPNHLHGIVVFADPAVEAPTCPRGYRAFGTDGSGSTEGTGDSPSTSDTAAVPSDSRDSPTDENASTGAVDDLSEPPDSRKASTGGSTLCDENTDAHGGKIDGGGPPDTPDGKSDPAGESDDDRPTGPAPKSLGSFIAGFKSAATTRINDHRGTPGAPVWQRNYHDRIIRTERHWRAARKYIRRNPADWGGGRHHQEA